MKEVTEILTCIILGLLVVAVSSMIVGLVVWLLWNAVIPTLFGLPTLTYVQAFLLTWLCSCLFKATATSKK